MKSFFYSGLALLYSVAFGGDQYREPPLRELTTSHTLRAKDFGAVPNDGLNDREAIQGALDALSKMTKPTQLIFEKGHYYLDMHTAKKGERNFMLILEDCSNAVIDFRGAHITVQNPLRGFFRAERCEQVIVKNGIVDYDPIPHTEGVVQAVDSAASTVDVLVRENFPAPDLGYFNEASHRWGCQLDPSIPGRIKTGASNFFFYNTVRKIEGRLFRVELKVADEHWPTIEVGDRFALLARSSGSFFHVRYSKQFTAMDMTSYNTPGGHYVSVMTEAYNILGCQSPIKPGHWKGGNADAVHCQSNRVGPWVEDCFFEGISDDSLVIYARPFSVVEQLGPKRLKISRLSNQNKPMPLYEGEVRVGDKLDFLNPMTGIVLATATVTAYDERSQIIELDLPVEGLTPGIDKRKTQIWNRAMGKGFVMKNNILKNSRRYGIYVKGSNGLIEGNYLVGLSSCAISLHNEPRAPNGPFCHDIDIRNNIVEACGFDEGFLRPAETGVFRVTARRFDYKDAESGTAHSNINISNNQFAAFLRPPVFLSNVDGAKVVDNLLDGRTMKSSDMIIRSSEGIEVE